MKKRSILNSVAVKTPCTQDWDLMYGNDEVRFCEHCVKHVHDLSAMTRREAEKLVTGANGSICVRYIRRPDGKMQTAGDQLYQISARASRLAAGVFGASLTLASSVYSQGDITNIAPAQEQTAVKPDTQKNEAGPAKGNDAIFGTVTDPMGAVVPGTEVILTDQKTGATQTVRSGDDGYYSFSAVAEGTYKLEFKSPGFATLTINNINYKDRANEKQDVVLPVGAIMGDIAIIADYENQLVRAVYYNEPLEKINLLIAQGVNVNEKDSSRGVTALHIAVRHGALKTVKMLLQYGAKANVRDDQGRTALMQIGEDFADEESNESEEVNESVENNESEEIDESVENNESEVAEEAAEARSAQIITDIFDLLIAYGAKVNLRDSEGYTALMHAARSGEPALLQRLISHKANINTQAKDGRTALMEAADGGDFESVKILLEAGANVNLKDDEGETALYVAYDDDIQQLLISYGAKSEEPEEPEEN